jgi:hypothetical protein
MLREIVEVDVNDEKFRILYDILVTQSGSPKAPSEKLFQNRAKNSGLTKEEISSWYKNIVSGE